MLVKGATVQHQAITRTSAYDLSVEPPATNSSEIRIKYIELFIQ